MNLAAALSDYGQAHILFWNANMQGKYRFYKNLREHPVRTSVTQIGGCMMLGSVALPLLNDLFLPALYEMAGMGGDDDESYFNSLTDWERTHNLCFRLPNGDWLKIPVSPDLSPWLSMGDVIGGFVSGKRELTAGDFTHAVIDAVSPLGINWSYEDEAMMLNVLPTVSQPMLQNMMNVNFMGNPIKKTPFNTKQGFKPEYLMTYRNTSAFMKELSRLSNRIGGGTDLKTSKNFLDRNPAMIQNLISGYAGGYGTTFLAAADWIVNTANGEKQAVAFSQMPFVSRFMISGNKDLKGRRIDSRFYDVKDFVDEFEYDRKSYQDKMKESKQKHDLLELAKYTSLLDELERSGRCSKYIDMKRSMDSVKVYEKYLDKNPDDEVTRNLVLGVKARAIERLHSDR